MNRILPIALVAAFSNAPASFQTETVAPRLEVVETSAITTGKAVTFRSEILSREVSMNLHVPESFGISSADHTYPIIFANGAHGAQFFTTLVGIVKHLGDRERIPESIVVSLNDVGDIPEIFTNGMWTPEKLGGSGEPGESLRHLEEEVIPYFEKHYRANHYRMIVGVSGSSLFPIYTFTQAPELFDSHVLLAAADTIGMGYRPGETFIDAYEAALATNPRRKAKLYVGVADKDVEKRSEYRRNLDDLAARLRRFENLDLRVEVVPKEDHYAVFIKAMLSAFDQNFPDERWSSRYRDLVAQPGKALENIDAYYAELSEDYGFTILPRADRWNNVNCLRFMIRHLIGLGRSKEAVAVAERRVEYRPLSSASFTGLADALEADGQLEPAVKAQETAIHLAKAAGDPDTTRLEARLEALKGRRQV